MVTFARFYGMHVLLLPPATCFLIALHVFLVRKHGVAPVPGDDWCPRKNFYPAAGLQRYRRHFHRVRHSVHAGAWRCACRWNNWPIPPTLPTSPRPEWYFLFLFQTLKLFNGPLEVVGSVVLPGLAILALILVPFIDRGRWSKSRSAPSALAFVVLAAIGWGGLTAAAVATTPKPASAARSTTRRPPTGCSSRPRRWPASPTSARRTAISCHVVGEHGTAKVGPDLTADVHPQGRRLDDPAFQAALGDAPGHVHAADPADRRAVELPGGVPAEAQSRQRQRARQRSRFRHRRARWSTRPTIAAPATW